MRLLLLCTFLLLTRPVFSQTAPGVEPQPEIPAVPGLGTPTVPLSESVFLDVKDLGTNLSSSENWRSYWGSYSKNTTRARGLEISLRNPAKIPGEYVVDWYFFAVPVRGGGKRVLFDSDTKVVALPPGGMQKATVISDTLESRSIHYNYDYYYYRSNFKSGTKPEGWIVTVSAGGKVIRVKTSGSQLDELYKRTDEFNAMRTPK